MNKNDGNVLAQNILFFYLRILHKQEKIYQQAMLEL